MIRYLLILMVLASAPLWSAEAPTTRVLFLVDASATMSTAWSNGEDRMGALRRAFDALGPALAGQKEPPLVLVRVFGASTEPGSPNACGPSRTLGPWARADADDLRAGLDAVQPRGAASLTEALLAAAEDLGTPAPTDLVLIISDGMSPCSEEFDVAFEQLTRDGEGAEVHLFAVGAEPEWQGELEALVPIHTVSWPSQLSQNLWSVINGRIPLPLGEGLIRLRPGTAEAFPFSVSRIEVNPSWKADPITATGSGDDFQLTGQFGTVDLTFWSADETRSQSLLRIPVAGNRALEVDGWIPENLGFSWLLAGDGWGQAPRLVVQWPGVLDGAWRWVFTRPGAPGASWLASGRLDGARGPKELTIPHSSGDLVFQLRRLTAVGEQVMIEFQVPLPPRTLRLQAPPEAEAGASCPIEWMGLAYPGDRLTLVPEGTPLEALGSTVSAEDGPAADFEIPFDQCRYELRYIDWRSTRVVTRASIEVSAERASLALETPASTSGQPMTLHWIGPSGDRDVLTLAEPEDPPEVYLDWASPARGSPTTLVAPRTPGTYEIRYVREGSETIAAVPVTVEPMAVTLQLPSGARTGTRIPVAWTGPGAPDDYIVLIPAGGEVQQHLDFAYAAVGSPTTLAAPDLPGDYEVQYVTTKPLRVLASESLTVTE